MRDEKITIGFEFTDEYGDHYSASSSFVPFEDNHLLAIGECLNNFLRQLTYHRPNDYIFMQDITEDEYEELELHLKEYRKSHKEEEDDEG